MLFVIPLNPNCLNFHDVALEVFLDNISLSNLASPVKIVITERLSTVEHPINADGLLPPPAEQEG